MGWVLRARGSSHFGNCFAGRFVDVVAGGGLALARSGVWGERLVGWVEGREVYPAAKLKWHFTCGFDFRHSL